MFFIFFVNIYLITGKKCSLFCIHTTVLYNHNYRLSYNRDLDQYSNIDGSVMVSVQGFGETSSVEDLGRILISIAYFGPLVEYFVDRGYERGKSIRAAPYDWRLAPGE